MNRSLVGLSGGFPFSRRRRHIHIPCTIRMNGDARCEIPNNFASRGCQLCRSTLQYVLCCFGQFVSRLLLCRRFGKQLATIVEPALPFVGHAATSAAAFTVGMGISQVQRSRSHGFARIFVYLCQRRARCLLQMAVRDSNPNRRPTAYTLRFEL